MNCQDHLHRQSDPRLVAAPLVSGAMRRRPGGDGPGPVARRGGLRGRSPAAPTPTAQGVNPLAPKPPHFAPKAKRVIFLFMAGGPSHLELFDNKPQLAKFDGKLPPAELLKGYRAAFINPGSKLLGPKFKFARHGQCGHRAVRAACRTWPRSSTTSPSSRAIVDRRLQPRSRPDHDDHRGADFGRPSMGAWVCYGLGSESQDLPGFVVFSTGKKGPSGGNSNWGSGFLPTVYQGVQFRTSGDPVLYLSNPPGIDQDIQRDSLDAIRRLDQLRLERDGRSRNRHADQLLRDGLPHADDAPRRSMDISREPQHILDLYGAEPGKPSFANNCLLARRLLERGVRFVQLFHEAWDQHGNLVARPQEQLRRHRSGLCGPRHGPEAARHARRHAGRLGRRVRPHADGPGRQHDGRDHHPNAFTMWLAGGGIKPGVTLGETDDLGFNVVKDQVHVHDLHATLLHLLGFDHTKLTYRFQGRDFRLTDVHGQVVKGLLA